jgi:hypothetical protein
MKGRFGGTCIPVLSDLKQTSSNICFWLNRESVSEGFCLTTGIKLGMGGSCWREG